jgi:hypothetical protein
MALPKKITDIKPKVTPIDENQFITWIAGTYGEKVAEQYLSDRQRKWFSYPPKSGFVGDYGRYEWGKLYDLFNVEVSPKTTTPSGTVPLTDTTGGTTPWEKLKLDEKTYASKYPSEYQNYLWQQTAIQYGVPFETVRKSALDTLGLGTTSNKGISDEYQAGLAWEKEKFGMQQDLANQDYNRQILGKQMEDSSAYAATVWKGIQENNPLNEYREDIKQQLYDEFERGKKAAEDSLEPADFVGRYLTKSVKNPNNPPRQTNALEDSSKQLEQLKVQKDYYTEQLKALNKNIKDPENPTYMDTNTKTLLSFVKAQIKDAEDRISTLNLSNSGAITPAVQRLMDKNPGSSYMDIMQAASEYMNNPGAEGTVKGQKLPAYEGLDMETKQLLGAVGGELYYEPYVEPKEPELDIPDWLQPMVEGEPTSVKGTDVKKWASAITPSGQGWNRLAPTQKNMFASYADKTGRTAEDLYSSMQMQLPKTLQLGRNWSASKRFY